MRIVRRRRRGPRRRTAVPWEGLAKILTERRRLGVGRAGWTRGGEKARAERRGRRPRREEGAAAGGGRRSPEARAIGIGGGGGELESCPLN